MLGIMFIMFSVGSGIPYPSEWSDCSHCPLDPATIPSCTPHLTPFGAATGADLDLFQGGGSPQHMETLGAERGSEAGPPRFRRAFCASEMPRLGVGPALVAALGHSHLFFTLGKSVVCSLSHLGPPLASHSLPLFYPIPFFPLEDKALTPDLSSFSFLAPRCFPWLLLTSIYGLARLTSQIKVCSLFSRLTYSLGQPGSLERPFGRH